MCHFLRRTVTFIGSHWGYLQAAWWQWNMPLPWLQKHGLAWLFFPDSAGDKLASQTTGGDRKLRQITPELELNKWTKLCSHPQCQVTALLCVVCKGFLLCLTLHDACCEKYRVTDIFRIRRFFSLIASHCVISKHGNTVDFTWINDLKSIQTQTQAHLCKNNLFHISKPRVMDHFPTPQNKTSIEPRGFSTPPDPLPVSCLSAFRFLSCLRNLAYQPFIHGIAGKIGLQQEIVRLYPNSNFIWVTDKLP